MATVPTTAGILRPLRRLGGRNAEPEARGLGKIGKAEFAEALSKLGTALFQIPDLKHSRDHLVFGGERRCICCHTRPQSAVVTYFERMWRVVGTSEPLGQGIALAVSLGQLREQLV